MINTINICIGIKVLKWSSRGGTVRLVDPQEKQLQDGLKYVEQLRADATNHEGNWGKIETSQPSSLQSTLKVHGSLLRYDLTLYQ